MPLAETNGFHWVNDPLNIICDQSNHGATIGHNNVVVKRKQMKMRMATKTTTKRETKKKSKNKALVGDTSFRLHLMWFFPSINVTFDVFGLVWFGLVQV